jgi:membrane protein
MRQLPSAPSFAAALAARFVREALGLLWRVALNCANDRVTYLAGGVTYFILFNIFPVLGAVVALYGLYGEPAQAPQLLERLGGAAPPEVISYLGRQMTRLADQGETALSLQLVVSLAIAVWAANAAVKALVWGLNLAYRVIDRRNWAVFTWLTLRLTFAGVVFGFVVVLLMGVTPRVEARLGLNLGLSLWRWPALLLADGAMLWALYRWGPCPSREARRRRILPGVLLAAAMSLAVSAAFSWYVADGTRLQSIYGPLSATVAFMAWTWLTVIGVLAGAELNGELERRE